MFDIIHLGGLKMNEDSLNQLKLQMQANNLLLLSMNPAVPKEIREKALNTAMEIMGFQLPMSQNIAQFDR